MQHQAQQRRSPLIPPENLKLSTLNGLLSVAGDEIHLLPAVIHNLKQLQLYVCTGVDGEVEVYNSPRFKRPYLKVAIEGHNLELCTEVHPYVNVSSVSGDTLFFAAAKINSRKNQLLDIELNFGAKTAGNRSPDRLIIPAEIFKPKYDIFESKGDLEVLAPRYEVSSSALVNFKHFFENNPEIDRAFYGERERNDNRDHLIILETSLDTSQLDRFLLTVPSLILSKNGFSLKRTWVFYSKQADQVDDALQLLYSRDT